MIAAATAVAGQTVPPPGKPTTAETAALERRLVAATRSATPSAEAFHALAAFYLRQGRLAAAIPHLERAQQIDPGHAASGYDLTVALLESNRTDAARAQVMRMLRAKETGELLNLLGDVEERSGNLAAAAEAYQRAAHADATEEHLFDWGNNLIRLEAFDAAAEVFTAAVARHPRSARLHVGLGIAHYSRGEYAQAVTSFCTASDLAPADPRPHQFLGEMYGVAPDQTGEVTRRLARFVKAQPRNGLAHLHYALSIWKGQPGAMSAPDARRVETLLRRAVALDPKLVTGFLQLGILLSEQERYQEALVPLRRATELQPDLAQAHYRLSQAYQRTGQHDSAAKELELFRKLTKEQSKR